MPEMTAMIRIVFTSTLLIFAGVTVSGCDGAYAVPSRAISDDIAASRSSSGSTDLSRNQTLDFRAGFVGTMLGLSR